MMYKQLSILTIATIATMMITASLSLPFDPTQTAQAAKVKCNNVKILVTLNNVENGTKYKVEVTLNNVTKSKTQTAELEENETSIKVPISFKKLSPCPEVGDEFTGTVNGGNDFSGELKSLKKPTKVSVDL